MLLPWIFYLRADEQLLIEYPTGKKVFNGAGTYFSKPLEKVKKRKAIVLEPTDYLHVKNNLSGDIFTITGPRIFFPEAYDEVIKTLKVITLLHNEYIKIIDRKTGVIRVEKGEKSIFLTPLEEKLTEIQNGHNIDEHNAVIVRNTENGSLELITETQVFFPSAYQEVIETSKKILLEEHETVIIKDKKGNFIIRKGSDRDNSFFLEPYSQLVKFIWSSGLHKDQKSLIVSHLDSRPKFMWYEFQARTKDNVELIIGITFFWQIVDVKEMLKKTDDVPGDLCSHARSVIIQSISKVTLEDFLASFNSIIRDAIFIEEDNFYWERGVNLQAVEVRSIDCKAPETQKILQEIIQETTNRINQIQKQESENEVKIKKIKGEILVENMKGELLEIRRERSLTEASIAGEAEAEKVKAFMELLGEISSRDEVLNIFNLLRKQDNLETLSKGKAQLFFTPADIDLKIETKQI